MRRILVIIAMCLSLFTNVAFARDISSDSEKPQLKMGGNNVYSLEAGKATELTIPIVNPSGDIASGVLIKAKPADNAPITIKFLNSSDRAAQILRGGSHNVVLSIDVESNATSGKYPITLDYSFSSISGLSFTGQDTFYVKIDNGATIPTLALDNIKISSDKVTSGSSVTVTANLENISKLVANNVNVEVGLLSENNMTVIGGSSNIYFPSLNSSAIEPISFNIGTTNLTKEGSNKISLKLTYTDNQNKEYSKEYFTYINVIKPNSNVNQNVELKISSVVAPSGTFKVGQSGTFKVKVKNVSKSTAKNIKVSAKVPEGIVPTSSNILFIEELAPNSEKELSFSVAPTSSASTQTYSIGFSIEYKNSSSTKEQEAQPLVIEQYAGMNVNNPTPKKEGEAQKTSVPKIIVSKYSSTPTIVEAGKSFKLSMNFKNTHNTKTVKNIKIFLTVEDKTEEKGNVFAPDNSSTTYFIDSIAPKQEVSHTFNLFAVPDAKPRSYTINVNLEYEDEQANEYKSVELVGINVKQQANLELSEITKQDTGTVGTPMNINFQLYNTGKVTLSNLMIKLEGEGLDTSNSTNFIGNFASGSSEYYDGSFIPTEAGEKTVKVIVTYEDTDGKELRKEQEIKVNIEDMPMEEDPNSQDVPPEKEKKSLTSIIGIICVIAFVVGIIAFIIIKKAKAKKEFDFND